MLATHSGAKHVIGCASGTDAIVLALMALGVGRNDAVFCPSFTFAATAEAVALVGATPVFVDIVPDIFNIDPRSLEAAIAMVRKAGALKPVGVIAVDLFGQPADYRVLNPIARQNGLWLIADAAQSYGAKLDNRCVGMLAPITTVSFFPSKPLGCYGDGGAVMTDDDKTAELVRSLLFHGMGGDRYEHVRIGMNGRLDTIQAAILIEKLSIFDDEIEQRQVVAVMHVTSADRTYEDIVATTAQSKNHEYRPPFGRLANCTQALFRSRSRTPIPGFVPFTRGCSARPRA
jgi:dTDP-4-amino-4,6-dideoxygalactose transaminase